MPVIRVGEKGNIQPMRASHRQAINDNQCGAMNKSWPAVGCRAGSGGPADAGSLLRNTSALIAVGNPVLGDDRLHRITFGPMFEAPPAGHPFPTVITPGTPPVATRMPAQMVHRIAASDDGDGVTVVMAAPWRRMAMAR